MTTNVDIYYLDYTRTDRDDRWEASKGEFIGMDKYTKVASFQTDAHDKEDAAEKVFEVFNGEQKPRGIRSLSVGDIVEVEGQKLLCLNVGWKQI
jgi:hypothetical protein